MPTITICCRLAQPSTSIFTADLKCPYGRVFEAWARQAGVQEDAKESFTFWKGNRWEALEVVSPLMLIEDHFPERTPSQAPESLAGRLEPTYGGVHLPPQFLPLLPPPPAQFLPAPNRLMRVLEQMGPLIVSFAATTPVDVSRFALVSRAWSSRASMMPDTTCTSMLGLSKYLRDEASVRAAITLLRNVVRPASLVAQVISQPLKYKATFRDFGKEWEAYECLSCSAIEIAGKRLFYVDSAWHFEYSVGAHGLYLLTDDRRLEEVCYVETDGGMRRMVNLRVFLPLRDQLRTVHPELSALQDRTLMVLLFFLMQRWPSEKWKVSNHEGLEVLDDFLAAIESLPTYPEAFKAAAVPASAGDTRRMFRRFQKLEDSSMMTESGGFIWTACTDHRAKVIVARKLHFVQSLKNRLRQGGDHATA